MLKLSILFFLLVPTLVFSHGLGNEVRKNVDGFFFEFGTDNTIPKAGEKVSLSFSFHNSTEQPLETDFWLRISKGDKIFFSTSDLRFKKSGPVFISYVFPEAGNYTLDISTKLEGKEVKTFFSVDVQDSIERYITPTILIILLIILLCFKKFRGHKKHERSI